GGGGGGGGSGAGGRRGGGARGPSVTARLRAAVRGLGARSPDGRKPGAASVDILAAGEVLAPLADRCGTDFERFLTEIALGAEADALDPRADAVTLLTMHAARGWRSTWGSSRGASGAWFRSGCRAVIQGPRTLPRSGGCCSSP